MKSLRLVTLVAALAAACGDEQEPAGEAVAAAGEGMCAEHGVLEALCTKCNPALIPVFQARGDWCPEHGFPESICPICHPERGGRPPVDVGAEEEEPPGDGTKVRLSNRQTAERVGIETEAAAPSSGSTELPAPARIVYDATRVALVNARSPGVVRSIAADVGTAVAEGAALATIESAEVGADQARATSSAARVEAAQAAVARAETLRAEGIGSERELIEARQELAAAQGEQRAARASLRMLGGGGGAGRYVLSAPLAGVVTRRTATLGMLVGPDDVLFEIVDTSRVWAEIDVPEDVARMVAPGTRVTFTVDGLPGRELEGEVTYVAPEIDPHTRSVRARVPLDNPDGQLRANMFAEARLQVRSPETGVWVPRDALQRARGAHLVFVRLSPTTFDARRVEPLVEVGARVLVRGRVAAGELVVTTGSFLLKTETLRESIGAGCCVDE